jgi:hypothetical protein
MVSHFGKEKNMSKTMVTVWFCLVGMVLGASVTVWAAPMGTAFLYQGSLKDGDSPANGVYDFGFGLYDGVSGGKLLGTETKDGVVVNDGYFQVELDFGSSAFTGNARWLEIAVRGPGERFYTLLTPRQELKPTPYSLYTQKAAIAEEVEGGTGIGGSGTANYIAKFADSDILEDSIMYQSGGSIGIGLTNPNGNLHIKDSTASVILEDTEAPLGYSLFDDNPSQLKISKIVSDSSNSLIDLNPVPQDGTSPAKVRFFRETNTTGVKTINLYRGDGTNTADAQIGVDGSNSYFQLNGGNFGIGKNNPGDELDVNGHINSSESYKLDGDTVLSNPGTNNIFAGIGAGASITSGDWNSAMGNYALYSNTTGIANSAMGNYALCYNTTGTRNAAAGYNTLYSNTTGHRNSAMGYYSLYSNTEGDENSAMGCNALFSNTTGYDNSAMGYQSLCCNTTGYQNSAMGYQALYSNTTGVHNTAMGHLTLYSNTIGGSNSAMGHVALYSNTEGHYNAALGTHALYSNTEGSSNTAMGTKALYCNTTGHNNSAVGYCALRNNTMGHSNSAMGTDALYYNTTGINNLAIGFSALSYNTSGNYNVAVGHWGNAYNEEGSNNTIIGYGAGCGTAEHNKSGNIFIGYQAGYNEMGDNKLYIENSQSSSPLIYGEFDNNVVVINGDLGVGRSPVTNELEVEGNASKTAAGDWLANSDARIKTDIRTVDSALETLDKVRLVSFRYTDGYRDAHASVADRRYMNVIAQEFGDVFPDYVQSSGEKLPNGEEILQVDPYPLTIYSAAAVQELHKIVKAKDVEINKLKQRNQEMEARLTKLESLVGKLTSQQ